MAAKAAGGTSHWAVDVAETHGSAARHRPARGQTRMVKRPCRPLFFSAYRVLRKASHRQLRFGCRAQARGASGARARLCSIAVTHDHKKNRTPGRRPGERMSMKLRASTRFARSGGSKRSQNRGSNRWRPGKKRIAGFRPNREGWGTALGSCSLSPRWPSGKGENPPLQQRAV